MTLLSELGPGDKPSLEEAMLQAADKPMLRKTFNRGVVTTAAGVFTLGLADKLFPEPPKTNHRDIIHVSNQTAFWGTVHAYRDNRYFIDSEDGAVWVEDEKLDQILDYSRSRRGLGFAMMYRGETAELVTIKAITATKQVEGGLTTFGRVVYDTGDAVMRTASRDAIDAIDFHLNKLFFKTKDDKVHYGVISAIAPNVLKVIENSELKSYKWDNIVQVGAQKDRLKSVYKDPDLWESFVDAKPYTITMAKGNSIKAGGNGQAKNFRGIKGWEADPWNGAVPAFKTRAVSIGNEGYIQGFGTNPATDADQFETGIRTILEKPLDLTRKDQGAEIEFRAKSSGNGNVTVILYNKDSYAGLRVYGENQAIDAVIEGGTVLQPNKKFLTDLGNEYDFGKWHTYTLRITPQGLQAKLDLFVDGTHISQFALDPKTDKAALQRTSKYLGTFTGVAVAPFCVGSAVDHVSVRTFKVDPRNQIY